MAAVDPEHALLIAVAQHEARQFAAAEAMCRRILEHQPHHAAALHRLALIAIDTGRLAEARTALEEASVLEPGQARYHCDLGLVHRLEGRIEDAVPCFEQAVVLDAALGEAHLNLADSLCGLGRYEAAIAAGERAVALRPNDPLAHNNLGNALKGKARREEAIVCYRRALALRPAYAEACNNLANALLDLRRWDDAIACYAQAIALQPDFAEAHSNMGSAWQQKGNFSRAMDCFRTAISHRADLAPAHSSLGMSLLLLGHYEEGWRENEWRTSQASSTGPRWNGARIPGQTLLVRSEQGFGDVLHFMRYVPLVRERSGAARVIVQCPPEHERLLVETGGWNAEIVAHAPPAFDQQVPLLSLPFTLGVMEPLPMPRAYLHANPALRREWQERLAPRAARRVGIAWAGNPLHDTDDLRSIALEKLAPLFRIEAVSFYSLQIGENIVPRPLIDLTAAIADFADTAALLAELDLVISVDTAVAHLAGAMGRPVWTLLPFVPDWRWGLGREDTPWYPTMRLFRQPVPGDWGSVVQRVASELTRWPR